MALEEQLRRNEEAIAARLQCLEVSARLAAGWYRERLELCEKSTKLEQSLEQVRLELARQVERAEKAERAAKQIVAALDAMQTVMNRLLDRVLKQEKARKAGWFVRLAMRVGRPKRFVEWLLWR